MKKLKSFLRTKTKTNVLVVVSAFIILSGRFLYVPFIADWDVKFENGIVGFKWLSIFLSRFGNEISWLAMGVLLSYISKYLPKPQSKHIKNLSMLVIITAGYFLSWIFYSESSFSRETEMLFSLSTSIAAYILSSRLLNSMNRYVDLLKEKIRNLVDIIIMEAPEHVNNLDVWDIEIVEPTLDMLNEE